MPAAVVLLASLGVYLLTLAPSIAWGDSPELTAAAYAAGVPHPTGYPLYMLLAHAFLKAFPVGSVAYRMNLLSAVSAAAAAALVGVVAGRFVRSPVLAAAAALLFAFSRTLWSQAVVAEVYAFQMLLTAGVLACLLAWDRRGEQRWLLATAFVWGLGFAHHLMSVLLAPALLGFVLTSPHRLRAVRALPLAIPIFLLPLLLYAYLPLRALADPPLNWGDPRTWPNFLDHVTGRQYQARMFGSPAVFQAHLRSYFGAHGLAAEQFGSGWLWLAVLGAASLARRSGRLFLLTGLVYGVTLLYALNYDIPDIEAYYLPSHLVLALWIACGTRLAFTWMKRRATRPVLRRAAPGVAAAVLILLPFSALAANWEANDRSGQRDALVYARATLDALPPDAVLIGGVDDPYFPLLYARFVEDRRPDVTILNAFDLVLTERLRLTTRLAAGGLVVNVPECFRQAGRGVHLDNCLMRQIIQDNLPHRPVFVLGIPRAIEALPWMQSALAPYFRLARFSVPLTELSRRAPILDAGDQRPELVSDVLFSRKTPDANPRPVLRLEGYDLRPIRRGEIPWFRIRYYWEPLDPDLARRTEVRALLADEQGNYPVDAEGSAGFYDQHALGCGFGGGRQPVPRRMRETVDFYLPPHAWNRPVYLWLAVIADGQFLAATGKAGYYVRVAPLPPTPSPM